MASGPPKTMRAPPNPTRGLKLLNSWGQEKTLFAPIDPKGQAVKVYVCGPTVYDSAHLGHARAYLTFDIILRILKDYFGYDLFYVMNITDVDDKIILRARQNYLFDIYVKEAKEISKILEDMKTASAMVRDKHQKKIEALKLEMKNTTKKKDLDELSGIIGDEQIKLGNVDIAEKKAKEYIEKMKKEGKSDAYTIPHLLTLVKSEVAYMLDKAKGKEINDLTIFRKHAAKYEQEFLEDLESLGIRFPSIITRVSEYIQEIIDFVKKLVDKGVAYESNGSVYFNVAEFSQSHAYCKLRPECAANVKLAEEGEGSLGSSGEKRHPSDFALWKKSKLGEPVWDSPWGKGRPGWHIECSAMSGQILGRNFDIHGGGADLKFPHHDNEIAQSEAFFDTHQWVNYWMHAGHLHIKGKKMSKSLKNFTTIRAFLKDYTPKTLRLMFLLARWDSGINFDENSLQEVLSREKQIKSFFADAKDALRKSPLPSIQKQKWGKADSELNDNYLRVKSEVHDYLCDNLNWPEAMKKISELITEGHKYLRDRDEKTNEPTFKPFLLKEILSYVTRILKVFGLISNDSIGFAQEGAGGNREDAIKDVVDALTKFRNLLRGEAKTCLKNKAPLDIQKLMGMCDDVRDDVMPRLGVRILDTNDGSSWSLEDPAVLLKEAKERKAEKERHLQRARQKLENKLQKIKDDIKSFSDFKTAPSDFFRSLHPDRELFTKYDDNGQPTHRKNQDGTEEELKKSALKKLGKDLKKYQKNFDKCIRILTKDPKHIEKLQDQAAKIEKQLKS